MSSTPPRPLALVTGASSGIGLELARQLAEGGHDLVLVARGEARLRELADELRGAHGATSHVVALDLADPSAARALAERLERDGLAVDVLVNNAGFASFGPFVQAELDNELRMIQVNVAALTALTHRVLPGMVARGRGRVLNVASTAAFQPGPLMAVYYATKAFVLSLSEALAEELAGTGVSVTALCPGPTESGFQSRAKMEESKLVKGKRLMGSPEVARAGLAALWRGQRVVIPGVQNKVMAQSVRFLPRVAVTRIVKKVQEQTHA